MKKLTKEQRERIRRESENRPIVLELRRLYAKGKAELEAKRRAEEQPS